MAHTLPVLLLALACKEEPKKDGPGGHVVDPDTGDPTDTDPPPDTDTPPIDTSGVEGNVLFQVETDDGFRCDMEVEFAGTPFTGACEGCDWAFTIDSEVTRNDNRGDCYPYPFLSLSSDYYYGNLIIAYGEEFRGRSNMFLVGYQYTGYYYYDYDYAVEPAPPGGYVWWRYVAYTGSPYGTFSQLDSEFQWTWGLSYGTYDLQYHQTCGYTSYMYGTNRHVGAYYGQSDVWCPVGYYYSWVDADVDVWSIQVPEGQSVGVTVNTLSDETAFDPMMWVNDGEACTDYMSYGGMRCEYGMTWYQCPAVEFVSQGGSYELVVTSQSTCSSGRGEYELRVETSGDPLLALNSDDMPRYEYQTVEIRAEGHGRLLDE
jgi:hypothetical protein